MSLREGLIQSCFRVVCCPASSHWYCRTDFILPFLSFVLFGSASLKSSPSTSTVLNSSVTFVVVFSKNSSSVHLLYVSMTFCPLASRLSLPSHWPHARNCSQLGHDQWSLFCAPVVYTYLPGRSNLKCTFTARALSPLSISPFLPFYNQAGGWRDQPRDVMLRWICSMKTSETMMYSESSGHVGNCITTSCRARSGYDGQSQCPNDIGHLRVCGEEYVTELRREECYDTRREGDA